MPRLPVTVMRAVSVVLRQHFPGAIALCAAAVAAVLWNWVTQDTSVTMNIFFGWRQSVTVFFLGLGVGGLAAELTALAAASSPGETPIGSTVIALIFALPFYGVMILLGIASQD